ncbi:MAG: hypothetical protein A2089_03865 [Elusimicrobia bacterium GWD2_63_28]|nr:MAG: hypothetical protein A2089_03865 [Elusimicrobia bacterium GWD2_63_28]
MTNKHRDTINAIKQYLIDTGEYEFPSERFFEKEIKPTGSRGAWGYTPDINAVRKDGARVIVEVEYGVSLGKVIEDIILSNLITPPPLLIIVSPYSAYVSSWYELLKKEYKLSLKMAFIECKDSTSEAYSAVVSKFKDILNNHLPHQTAT